MYLNSKEILSLLALQKHWVCDICTRWYSQDDQRLDGGDEGRSPEQSVLLEGCTVTGQVETSSSSDDGYLKIWQVKVGHGGEKSLGAPAEKGLLEGAATCNLEGEYNILDKKKVKSVPVLTTQKVFLIVFT